MRLLSFGIFAHHRETDLSSCMVIGLVNIASGSTINGGSALCGWMEMHGMSKSSTTIDGVTQRVTTSPGEMLREEFMVPLGLSANALALALRVPANRVTAILKEERAVTADTALRLGRYFGTSARFWLNLQQAFDLSRARSLLADRIEKEVSPREVAA